MRVEKPSADRPYAREPPPASFAYNRRMAVPTPVVILICALPGVYVAALRTYWQRAGDSPTRHVVAALGGLVVLAAWTWMLRHVGPNGGPVGALSAASILAVTMVPLGAAAAYAIWRDWDADPVTKVACIIGLLILVFPGSCFGIVISFDIAGFFQPYHP